MGVSLLECMKARQRRDQALHRLRATRREFDVGEAEIALQLEKMIRTVQEDRSASPEIVAAALQTIRRKFNIMWLIDELLRCLEDFVVAKRQEDRSSPRPRRR